MGATGSSESSMASLEQQPRHQQPICPQCGNAMHLTGRTAHPDYGAYYERQTFMCYVCRYESQRSADANGNPHN
jgi:tRNA(Ile2) C34 agmatinyltransferase TiaS